MIEPLSKGSINTEALLRITRSYEKYSRKQERQILDLYDSVYRRAPKTLSEKKKRERLAEAITPILSSQKREAEKYFIANMLLQYEGITDDFLKQYSREIAGTLPKRGKRDFSNESSVSHGDNEAMKKQREKRKGYKDAAYIRYITTSGEAALLGRSMETILSENLFSAKLLETGESALLFDGKIDRKSVRDIISHVSDDSLSSASAYWQKTTEDVFGVDLLKEGKKYAPPILQHVAHANACAWCKQFDVGEYIIYSSSKRPHDSCRCSRIPVAYADQFDDTQDWREQYENDYSEIVKATAEEGDPTFKMTAYQEQVALMNRIRTAERHRAQGRKVDYKKIVQKSTETQEKKKSKK